MASIGFPEIFLAVICFIIFYCKRTYNGLPRIWPLVGALPGLIHNFNRIHDWLTEVVERSGGTLLFSTFNDSIRFFLTVDPSNIHYMLSENFSNFPKGSKYKNRFDFLGDGIFNVDLDSWKNQRLVAQLFLNQRRFQQFSVKTTQKEIEKGLIPVLEHVCEQGQVVDLQDVFRRFTFDVTFTLVCGYNPASLCVESPQVPFLKALAIGEEAIFYRHIKPEMYWRLERWLDIGAEKKLKKAWETADIIITEYLSMKREGLNKAAIAEEEADSPDLLTSYMKEEKPLKELKSDDFKFLRDTFLNFMLAGGSTTSSALSWFFWIVATNQEVETRIREEIESEITAEETKNIYIFNEAELNKMVYLHGALCEALRLFPPVSFEHKMPLKPDTLPSGHQVNPDMNIIIPIYAMGRMKSIWGEDCLEFKPERWITKRGGIKHQPSYKFLAFNAGPRSCLGKEIAFNQMKAVAATILQNFNVKVVEGHCAVPCNSLILHMKHGLMVRITKRHN